MSERGPVTDEEITAQLARRAAGARLPSGARDTILSSVRAEVVQRRVGSRKAHLWTRIAAALFILVLGGVAALAWLGGRPALTSPSATTSASAVGSAPPATEPSAAAFTPSTPLPEPIRPLSADSLVALVGQAQWIGRVVLADVTIGPLTDLVDYDCATCPIGEIDGVTVSADAADVERLGDERARRGVIAFRIGRADLEALGPVTPWTEGLAWPVASAATAALAGGSAGGLVVAEGWLVTADPGFANCGPYVPRPTPTVEIAARFGCYPNTWITDEETQPLSWLENGASLDPPDGAVTVQRGAYWDYALGARLGEEGLAVPVLGVYLLELLVDEWDGCTVGCRGWQIVARLDPTESGGALLPLIVLRAEAAVPDTDLPPQEAQLLTSTARKWLIGQGDLADRPLAAAEVRVDQTTARITFHAYDTGETVVVLLEMRDGQPVSLVSAEAGEEAARLSGWEQEEARDTVRATGEYRVVEAAIPQPASCGGRALATALGHCARVAVEPVGDSAGGPVSALVVDLGQAAIVGWEISGP